MSDPHEQISVARLYWLLGGAISISVGVTFAIALARGQVIDQRLAQRNTYQEQIYRQLSARIDDADQKTFANRRAIDLFMSRLLPRQDIEEIQEAVKTANTP